MIDTPGASADIEQSFDQLRGMPEPSRPPSMPFNGSASKSNTERSFQELKSRLRIIIVDQNAFARAGLAHTLKENGFRVAADYASLKQLQSKLLCRNRCLMLIRVNNGAEAVLLDLPSLKSEYPALRIILLTDCCGPEERAFGIRFQVDAFLLSAEATPEVLKKTIELVLMGSVVVSKSVALPLTDWSPGVADHLMAPANSAGNNCDERTLSDQQQDARLSEREKTVLRFLTEGASNKQIARDLDISEGTVKVHVKSLLRKIAARNRTQAAMWAIRSVAKEVKSDS
jgi:two-component system nitrate/nitrite response regulator NarL